MQRPVTKKKLPNNVKFTKMNKFNLRLNLIFPNFFVNKNIRAALLKQGFKAFGMVFPAGLGQGMIGEVMLIGQVDNLRALFMYFNFPKDL